MGHNWIGPDHRTVLKRLLLVTTCIAIPVIAWAQWTTSGNDIYNSNTGKIGIGTTSPQTPVHIYSNSTYGALILESGASAAYSPRLYLWDDRSGGRNWVVDNGTYSGHFNVIDDTAGQLRMTIDASGYVGIGTAFPDRPFVLSGAAATDVDSKSQMEIHSTAAYNASPVAGLSFGLKYNSSGTAAFGTSIQGYKENATDGNFAQALRFTTQANGDSPRTRMTISSSGNVGIGTSSPSSKLDVDGDVTVSGNISAKYQDLAEWVPAARYIAPGTVVILDPRIANTVIPSFDAYDTSVAGVISLTPGIVLGESGEGKVRVATTGRVKVHVDATRMPIRIGDLLVTSDREGTAMRSEPIEFAGRRIHQPGTLIGKALESLSYGEGDILVLLSLQ